MKNQMKICLFIISLLTLLRFESLVYGIETIDRVHPFQNSVIRRTLLQISKSSTKSRSASSDSSSDDSSSDGTDDPSKTPTKSPSKTPTLTTQKPTRIPTVSPTKKPTDHPSPEPTPRPTPRPTKIPSPSPTLTPLHARSRNNEKLSSDGMVTIELDIPLCCDCDAFDCAHDCKQFICGKYDCCDSINGQFNIGNKTCVTFAEITCSMATNYTDSKAAYLSENNCIGDNSSVFLIVEVLTGIVWIMVCCIAGGYLCNKYMIKSSKQNPITIHECDVNEEDEEDGEDELMNDW